MTDGTDRDPFALAGHAGEGNARVLALFQDLSGSLPGMDRHVDDVDEEKYQDAYGLRDDLESEIIATPGGPVALAIKTYLSYRFEGSDWPPKLAMLRDPALLEGDPDITVSMLRDAARLVPELVELAAPIIHEDAALIDADIEVQWCRIMLSGRSFGLGLEDERRAEVEVQLSRVLDRIAQRPAKTQRGRAIKAKQASLVPLPAARVGDH